MAEVTNPYEPPRTPVEAPREPKSRLPSPRTGRLLALSVALLAAAFAAAALQITPVIAIVGCWAAGATALLGVVRAIVWLRRAGARGAEDNATFGTSLALAH
jgi:fatty acid desaturase